MTLSEKMAYFIVEKNFKDIPQVPKEEAKMTILDWIAAALAAIADAKDEIDIIMKALPYPHNEGKSKIIGLERRTNPLTASLINGYIGHLVDYDPGDSFARSHAVASMIPALLAIGEERRVSGEKFLESFIIGCEVGARIGEAITPDWVEIGWHGTSIVGIFMAAAGCGKILGLNSEQLQMAIGIAASLASGLTENFGTLTKPLHPGMAAHNGFLAALLASQGFTSSKEALEKGFFKAYAWIRKPRLETLEKLGNPWILETRGVIFPKLYPCCYGLTTSIECAFLLKEKHPFSWEDVEEIEIYSQFASLGAMMSRTYAHSGEYIIKDYYEGPPRLMKPGIPKTPTEAKFSKEFTFARAILDGEIKLKTFTEEKLDDPKVQELMKKTKVYHDPRLQRHMREYPLDTGPTGDRCVVKLKDGRILEHEILFTLGATKRPLSIDNVEKKFDDCSSEAGFSEERREKIKSIVKNLEKVEDISQLLELL